MRYNNNIINNNNNNNSNSNSNSNKIIQPKMSKNHKKIRTDAIHLHPGDGLSSCNRRCGCTCNHFTLFFDLFDEDLVETEEVTALLPLLGQQRLGRRHVNVLVDGNRRRPRQLNGSAPRKHPADGFRLAESFLLLFLADLLDLLLGDVALGDVDLVRSAEETVDRLVVNPHRLADGGTYHIRSEWMVERRNPQLAFHIRVVSGPIRIQSLKRINNN